MEATTTMRAARITGHGGVEVLESAAVPVPVPQPPRPTLAIRTLNGDR